MAITTIVMDVYKPGSELKNKVVDISDSFNARVGDNQVRLVIKYVERGIVERMEQEQLTPFMTGYVGQPDEELKVTAETGTAVSYHGSSEDIIGGGKVRMDLPGTMFPQEGAFYGFFGLENSSGKRVTTNNVFFKIENNNPDMYVDTLPFRTELQKLLDWATAQSKSNLSGIETDWEALKKTIKAMIDSGDTDLISIKNRIGLAEDELDKLLKMIDDKNLLTQDEFNAQIKIVNQNITDALKKLQGNIAVGDNIKIGKAVSKSNQSAIENLKSLVDPTLFNFVFFTDCHYDQWNDPNRTGLDRLNNALLMDGTVDAIIAGGDNIDGGSALYEILLSQHKEFNNDMFFFHNEGSDKFILKGNHDDGSGRQLLYRKGGTEFKGATPIPDEDLKRMYNNSALLNGEKRNGNSHYFYKDYPDKKIRLVGLNSNDTPDTIMDSDGFLKYPGGVYMGYRQEQINWLANTALQGVPEDYTTIIIGHVHAHARTGANVDESDIYSDHYYNIDIVDQIISDFMHGTSSNLTSTTKNWEVSVKTDFTSQGKRIMGGYIHGHQHKDNYTSDLGFNNIGITCSIGGDRNNPDDDGWVVVSVDPVKQTIQLRGFGHATSRSFKFINA